MTTALWNFFGCFFSLSRLTGPIFDKELRVSSRRRRNYVLRFAYLAFLTTFLVLIWIEVMDHGGSGLVRMSRMAEAGKAIVACIVWFQFCVTQIVAVIMLSTSISDEIYHRTLGLLMTTPINSFQIVMGKLLSKLLQLILLLAISLPLLAIVRVFGGVPWSYVISSLCITLATIIFVGSLSLFFSIFTRKAYVVIILTCLTIAALFALLPFMAFMFWHAFELRPAISEKTLFEILLLPNPYCNLFFNTMIMTTPRLPGGMPSFAWPLHCGIILAASAVLLSVCVIRVRKVALRQATGQLGASSRKRRSGKNSSRALADEHDLVVGPRRITGPPVLWRELKSPMLGRRRLLTVIGTVSICLIMLLVTYVLCLMEDILDDEEIQVAYAVIFLGLGMLSTVVLASTCITSEKESRSWPLLLTTTLDDKDILFGKFVGTVRRCLPVWLLLLGHTVLFSLTAILHPVAILQTGILMTGVIVFLAGSGLYFSSCYKRTTTAVMMNSALAVVIWAILPFIMAIIGGIHREVRPLIETCIDTNPFVHAVVIFEAAADNPGSYRWFSYGGSDSTDGVASTIWMLTCMVGYGSLGLLFAWRAKCRFRRNIF
ncbi:MAG: ABC transporter permease subunit [Planctomycetota bacterium]|jgi:ABC-type transport system involved in multi-copper enzyme maturation permease subunit